MPWWRAREEKSRRKKQGVETGERKLVTGRWGERPNGVNRDAQRPGSGCVPESGQARAGTGPDASSPDAEESPDPAGSWLTTSYSDASTPAIDRQLAIASASRCS